MVRSFRMSFYRIMPFVKREFYFFLSNQDAFISLVLSFFCLSVLAWSFDALFDSNSKCEYCHILDLERKKHNKFFFLHLVYVCYAFYIEAFAHVEEALCLVCWALLLLYMGICQVLFHYFWHGCIIFMLSYISWWLLLLVCFQFCNFLELILCSFCSL